MSVDTVIGIMSTVVAFATFTGILVWACAARRRKSFAEAANAPFALPDEIPSRTPGKSRS